MLKFILIGDSGHAKVIEDIIVANGFKVIAKLDDKYSKQFQEVGYIKGPISILSTLLDETTKIVICIGNNIIRQKIVARLDLDEDFYETLIHPSVVISSSATISKGTVVMPNAVINADAKVGKHSIINTGAIIEHDCIVEDYVHLSPGAVLTGGVQVGEGTQIGAKSVAIPLVKIGNWSMIGAGSTIIHNVESHVTAVGSPAKVIRKKES